MNTILKKNNYCVITMQFVRLIVIQIVYCHYRPTTITESSRAQQYKNEI